MMQPTNDLSSANEQLAYLIVSDNQGSVRRHGAWEHYEYLQFALFHSEQDAENEGEAIDYETVYPQLHECSEDPDEITPLYGDEISEKEVDEAIQNLCNQARQAGRKFIKIVWPGNIGSEVRSLNNVGGKALKNDTDIEGWIADQREAYQLGLLPAWKIKRLEQIPGWNWQ
jgi:hypothetical protein